MLGKRSTEVASRLRQFAEKFTANGLSDHIPPGIRWSPAGGTAGTCQNVGAISGWFQSSSFDCTRTIAGR
jgi:hypothetical protein